MMFKSWIFIVLGTIVLTGCGDSGPVLVPVEGTVTLDAFHRGNSIYIQVTDDGKGLDPDRILPGSLRDYAGPPRTPDTTFDVSLLRRTLATPVRSLAAAFTPGSTG